MKDRVTIKNKQTGKEVTLNRKKQPPEKPEKPMPKPTGKITRMA